MKCRQRYRNGLTGVKTYEQSVEDFWTRVESTNLGDPLKCWHWVGQQMPNGYGMSSFQGRKVGAHRASYIVHFGYIPNGLLVCHRCDNRICVNPNHLFLGTQKDNLRDCVSKGRAYCGKGERHPKVILKERDVISILSSTGISEHKLAAKYGVSRGAISDIRRGKNWKHLNVKTAASINRASATPRAKE